MRLNLGCGPNPIMGFINLDRSPAWGSWFFEEGLPFIADDSIAGVTVSHALMYVSPLEILGVLGEIKRVLVPVVGILRITEDDTEHPDSPRAGGFPGAALMTGPRMMRELLETVDFAVYDVGPGDSWFADQSLCQSLHGEPPKVFFIEGVKRSINPEPDDRA